MNFKFMAAIFDLSVPVTFDSTDNIDDRSSELNDLGNSEVAIEMPMIHSPLVNVQCTSASATAILHSSLPVISDSTDNMIDMSSELSGLKNLRVVLGISTIYSLPAYIQCTQGLAATILDLTLPVTSDSLYRTLCLVG